MNLSWRSVFSAGRNPRAGDMTRLRNVTQRLGKSVCPVVHEDSFISAIDDDHDDRIWLKPPSINVKAVPEFHGESPLNSVTWFRPSLRSNQTYSALSLFQLLKEGMAKGLDMPFWCQFWPQPFCGFLAFLAT
jgi:hypothetical protein